MAKKKKVELHREDEVIERPEPPSIDGHLTATSKLTKDLKIAAQKLTQDEARYLVDRYYQVQKDRIRAGEQERAAVGTGEPNALLSWNADISTQVENSIKKVLDEWTDGQQAGRWAKSQIGIGPVLAAGFLAHIDIRRSNTVGKIWRFAGLDPTVKWEKGNVRPWNARLKVLCWKAGDCFVKQHNHPDCFYGKVYKERKNLEIEKNLRGDFAQQAQDTLASKKFDKTTDTYKAYSIGQLPAGRIELRARRYAVKLFLSHLHHVLHVSVLGTEPVKPYVISILGHADMIQPPGWPCK